MGTSIGGVKNFGAVAITKYLLEHGAEPAVNGKVSAIGDGDDTHERVLFRYLLR